MRAQVAGCLVACEAREGGVSARFTFKDDLPIFAGHFPGRPLVPGVFLVEAARLAGERATGQALRISTVVKAKFKGEVGPGADVELEGELSAREGKTVLRARLHTQSGDAASLHLELTQEDV